MERSKKRSIMKTAAVMSMRRILSVGAKAPVFIRIKMVSGTGRTAANAAAVIKEDSMIPAKISRIISGSPVRPIVVGEPALIHESGGLRRTTPVLNVRRVSIRETRFETRNTQYVLKIVPAQRNGKE